MPKIVRMELAKAGIFGEDGTVVTAEDLQEIYETFSGKAPITPGHQLADWMPALGFVTAVSYDPKTTLFVGDKVELSELLDEALEKKLYGNWSIGVRRRKSDGKKYLHHLAILGAVPPKIKDLKMLDVPAINMADDADTEERWTFKLSDTSKFKFPLIGEILQKLRDYLIEKDGQEAADKVVNIWQIDELKRIEENQQISAEILASDNILNQRKEGERKMDKNVVTKGDGKGDINLSDQLLVAQGKIRAMKKDALKSAIAGKVPEAKHSLVLELADNLPVEDSVDLSDDTGSKKKVSAIDLLTEIFKAIPLPVKPGEMEMGDVHGREDKDIDGSKLVGKV